MEQICQSCGMPLSRLTRGSYADNRMHEEYCRHCFRGGSFTNPELTLEEQIERLADMAVTTKGISRDQALTEVRSVLPGLKRWL